MDYCDCEVYDNHIKPKSKNKQIKSSIHKEFDRCRHIDLTVENANINEIDEIFHAYIIEHNKKCDYYLMNCEFISIFNYDEYFPYVTSELYSNIKQCVVGINF